MTTRLKDIAEKTGFSVNTVSLALNNSPRISEETGTYIRNVAKELHYIPNRAAKSLVTRRSNMIGLVVRELGSIILNSVASKLEKKFYELGYSFVLVTSAAPKSELEALRSLEARQVDGIFMFPCFPPSRELTEYICALNIPVVLLSFGKHELFTDSIYIDNEYASYLATKYLISLGHRKIALICGSYGLRSSQIDCERLNGHCRALREADIGYDPAYTIITVSSGQQYKTGYEAAREIYNRTDATAIVAANDSLGVGAEQFYLNIGKKIPEDISIVSNDSTDIAAFAPVPITATYYNDELLTDKAIEIMINRIDNGKKNSFIRFPIKSTLDERKSAKSLIFY